MAHDFGEASGRDLDVRSTGSNIARLLDNDANLIRVPVFRA